MSAIEELERYYNPDAAVEDRAGPSGAGTTNPSVSEFSPATTEGQASTSATEDEAFISHILQKSDTLAGLAVQYNVAVSDIKRANGLMSESMMWVRSKLLIPQRPLPLSDEQQRQLAQLVSHTDPIDSSRSRLAKHVKGSPRTRADGMAALDQLSSYYELGDGGHARDWSSPRMRSATDPHTAGDVELGVLDAANVHDERAGETGDERVRLRARRGGDGDAADAFGAGSAGTGMSADGSENVFSACLPAAARSQCAPSASSRLMHKFRDVFGDIMEAPQPPRAAAYGAGPPRPSSNPSSAPSSTTATSAMPRVKSSSGAASFFTRLSAAAAQPALSGGGPSVSTIADGFMQGRGTTQAEPRVAQMRRQGSFSSASAAAKGKKGE